jgi:hypothetical protein
MAAPRVDLCHAWIWRCLFTKWISRKVWAHAGMRRARSGVRRMERIHSGFSDGCRNHLSASYVLLESRQMCWKCEGSTRVSLLSR